jgi:peptide/nickel transport system substrate-binding protein
MKLGHPLCRCPSGRTVLVVLAILFTLSAGYANSASEPGTVTIVLTGEPRDVDPGTTAAKVEGQVLMKNVVETLTEVDPYDNRITPRLATSWKQIDARTWQFFLRKGVKFHDGADFNAEAFIFNIKRLYDKRIVSNTGDKYFSGFRMEGKALDGHTLEIKLDKPEPLMLILMGTLGICSPNTPLDKLTRNPIGTGPYKFVKWDAGVQIILERFDGYWGKQPQVKKAVYIWRSEPSVRAAMVAIGEADLVPVIGKQEANRPDMDISYQNSDTLFDVINVATPPLNDRRVRLALNYAVDRNAIRGSILSKDVIPAAQMITPTIFGFNPDLKPWPYDPQKARQLLDEARKDGVPVDKEMLLVARLGNFPGAEELAEATLTMYRAVGLNMKLMIAEIAKSRVYDVKPYPPGPYLLQTTHDNNKADAALTVFNRYHCNGQSSQICDKKLDALIEKAQVSTGEERKSLWHAVFKYIHEDIVTNVMLFHSVSYARVGKRINFKPNLVTNNEIPLELINFKQ